MKAKNILLLYSLSRIPPLWLICAAIFLLSFPYYLGKEIVDEFQGISQDISNTHFMKKIHEEIKLYDSARTR
jgi:hypothetical protein